MKKTENNFKQHTHTHIAQTNKLVRLFATIYTMFLNVASGTQSKIKNKLRAQVISNNKKRNQIFIVTQDICQIYFCRTKVFFFFLKAKTKKENCAFKYDFKANKYNTCDTI